MAVKVDREKCIGCGTCAAICPEGFELDDEGKAKVKNPKAKCVDEAISSCPVEAISK
ncbi:MAG: ferredoxin [Candidatus Altiarchaeota archaeon]